MGIDKWEAGFNEIMLAKVFKTQKIIVQSE